MTQENKSFSQKKNCSVQSWNMFLKQSLIFKGCFALNVHVFICWCGTVYVCVWQTMEAAVFWKRRGRIHHLCLLWSWHGAQHLQACVVASLWHQDGSARDGLQPLHRYSSKTNVYINRCSKLQWWMLVYRGWVGVCVLEKCVCLCISWEKE